MSQSGGNLFLAILVGFCLHLLLGFVPIIGDFVAGLIAGYIARGAGRGAVAGFFSGMLGGILLAIILSVLLGQVPLVFRGIEPFIGLLQFGIAIILVAMSLKGAVIGLLGGLAGGIVSEYRRKIEARPQQVIPALPTEPP